MNRGRTLGPGRLDRPDSNWVLSWTDAQGRRRRKVLGADRRVAERIRAETIRDRDLALAGLGAVEGQDRRLSELVDLYLPDLAARTSAMHVKNVELRLRRTIAGLKDPRVRDLTPLAAIQYRNQRKAQGLANRTANLEVDVVRSMLRWAAMAQLVAQNQLHVLAAL